MNCGWAAMWLACSMGLAVWMTFTCRNGKAARMCLGEWTCHDPAPPKWALDGCWWAEKDRRSQGRVL